MSSAQRPAFNAWIEDVPRMLREGLAAHSAERLRECRGPNWAAVVQDDLVATRGDAHHFDAREPLRDALTVLIAVQRHAECIFPGSPGVARDFAKRLRYARNRVAHTEPVGLASATNCLHDAIGLLALVRRPEASARGDDLRRRLKELDHQGKAFPFPRQPLDGAGLSEALFIVPCSAHKVSEGTDTGFGPSIPEELRAGTEDELAAELEWARLEREEWARLDPKSGEMRAFRRYGEDDSTLWRGGGPTLREAVASGRLNLLFTSGAYGVVRGDERIHYYDGDLNRRPFDDRLIERVLVAYARISRERGVRRVIAFARNGSEYERVVANADWREAGLHEVHAIHALRVEGGTPHSDGPLGEAFAYLVQRGQIEPGWTSSEGAGLHVSQLHPRG